MIRAFGDHLRTQRIVIAAVALLLHGCGSTKDSRFDFNAIAPLPPGFSIQARDEVALPGAGEERFVEYVALAVPTGRDRKLDTRIQPLVQHLEASGLDPLDDNAPYLWEGVGPAGSAALISAPELTRMDSTEVPVEFLDRLRRREPGSVVVLVMEP